MMFFSLDSQRSNTPSLIRDMQRDSSSSETMSPSRENRYVSSATASPRPNILQGALVGRRGLAGTILAYKAASAVADEGANLEECKAVAEAVGEMLGTIGAGLNHCHVST